MTVLEADLHRSGIFLDTDRAKQMFERQPGIAEAFRIDGCAIVHTRYRMSRDDVRAGKAFLSVCYEVDVRERKTGHRATQWLHLKAYPRGKSRQKFEGARRRPAFRPRFGDAVVHLPELDAVVWSFPNDPKLPHLPEVIDPAAVRNHLPYRERPPEIGSPEAMADVHVNVVRYKPEVRCTTRYELRGGSGERVSAVVYGKTFAHRRGAEIARRIESLWRQSLSGADGSLQVARSLGYTEVVKTVWQETLPGRPLVTVMNGADDRLRLHAAAAGLARFHQWHLDGLPSTTLEDDLAAIRGDVAEIAQAFPRRAGRLGAMVHELERGLPVVEPQSPTLVHGDFLLKQLVLHEGRLGLCDFDNLSLGDPTRDLANFVVDLQPFGPGRAAAMAATFLDSYAAHTARPVPKRRLHWQCRLHVLRNAYYFYKRRRGFPGFEEELDRLLRPAHLPDFDA